MHRLIWLTDIHLNCASPEIVDAFLNEVAALASDAILLTGDIAESPDVEKYLQLLQRKVKRPVFFVLGNHDYYFSSIATVRKQIKLLCESNPQLVYMTDSDPVQIGQGIGLIGHDSWADGRIGSFERSMVRMHDYRLISDLADKSKSELWEILKSLGDSAAHYVRQSLSLAVERFSSVYLITHIPPFREACWHEGRISDDEWTPHFTCQAVGEAILETMSSRPNHRLTVLCGHTHGSGRTDPLNNVRVLTGGATYGYPGLAGVFDPCDESDW